MKERMRLMKQKASKSNKNQHESCGVVTAERNRYFTGKYMTARDFQAEQDYFLSRHRLHNRLMHGWGIVCGLEVKPHKDESCQDSWVIVKPGIAIDCCGRELILKEETLVEVHKPTPKDNDGVSEKTDDCDDSDSEVKEYLLCLEYVEKPIEEVPALDSDNCSSTRLEANRTREEVKLKAYPFEDFDKECWYVPNKEAKLGKKLGSSGCLEPHCPCGNCVPLALITPNEEEGKLTISTEGRRNLPTPSDYLTHIVGINWPHGGELSLAELCKMDGRLEITFDRDIKFSDDEGTGINEHTFVVQYGGVQRTLEFLPANCDPTLDEDNCRAVFTIDPKYIDECKENIAGNMVYITLKCDFVIDCNDNPVDGNFLKANCPTGDGIPGGVFESWFRVISETKSKPSTYESEVE